jgi:hypothetical protein
VPRKISGHKKGEVTEQFMILYKRIHDTGHLILLGYWKPGVYNGWRNWLKNSHLDTDEMGE